MPALTLAGCGRPPLDPPSIRMSGEGKEIYSFPGHEKILDSFIF